MHGSWDEKRGQRIARGREGHQVKLETGGTRLKMRKVGPTMLCSDRYHLSARRTVLYYNLGNALA